MIKTLKMIKKVYTKQLRQLCISYMNIIQYIDDLKRKF